MRRAFRRDRRGAVAIEFAFGLVPLVLVLFGGITYAGVLATLLSLTHAANEGARAAVAGLDDPERIALAEDAALDALSFDGLSAAAAEAAIDSGRLSVAVSVPYGDDPLTPILFFPVPSILTTEAAITLDVP